MNYNIVYILKNNIDPTELIYSVRSVCNNFNAHRGNIWFVGGKPENIRADKYMSFAQEGRNKWTKVTNTIRKICYLDEITNNFWLFNDDFFIMRPTFFIDPAIDGTISRRIREITSRNPKKMSIYAQQLYLTQKILRDQGYDTLNYALHIPMLINKDKALKTIKKFPNCPMFRSLYGNHHRIGGIIMNDIKVYDNDTVLRETNLLSTSDESFKNGKIGEYIRSKFPQKCIYET